jgi:Cu/Ag efflux pump CusA
MLNRLLEFSVRQRVFVLLATLVMVGIGVYSALRLPIDAVPDITNVQVQINTAVPALAPEEIEKLVTFPIENEMAGIPGLTELRSLSKFGLSQVNLIFEDGTDLYRSRQLVSERLQTVMTNCPPGLTPKLAPISTGLGEIYYYVVEYAPTRPTSPHARGAVDGVEADPRLRHQAAPALDARRRRGQRAAAVTRSKSSFSPIPTSSRASACRSAKSPKPSARTSRTRAAASFNSAAKH